MNSGRPALANGWSNQRRLQFLMRIRFPDKKNYTPSSPIRIGIPEPGGGLEFKAPHLDWVTSSDMARNGRERKRHVSHNRTDYDGRYEFISHAYPDLFMAILGWAKPRWRGADRHSLLVASRLPSPRGTPAIDRFDRPDVMNRQQRMKVPRNGNHRSAELKESP